MNPETQIIRQNILRVLREADRPLTTREVGDRCPKFLDTRPCVQGGFMHEVRHDGCYFLRCDGTTDTFLVSVNQEQRCLRELTRYERLGEVIGNRYPGQRAVLWTYPNPVRMAESATLEEWFAAPAYVRET